MFQPAIAGGVVCASVVAGAAYGTLAPRSALWAPVIWHGNRAGPARIALTFDDGPSPEWTPAVLDALAGLGVRAAFFVIGASAARHPALLRRIDAEGHIIGNHSFDHHHFGVLRCGRYWRDQLDRTDEVIRAETGRLATYFRPPMGFKTPHLARAARRRGQYLVAWTRRALDGVPTTDSEILRRLAGPTRPGDILAMHDGVEPRGWRNAGATVRAIVPLVRALRERGISPVRLDEIIGPGPYAPTICAGNAQP